MPLLNVSAVSELTHSSVETVDGYFVSSSQSNDSHTVHIDQKNSQEDMSISARSSDHANKKAKFRDQESLNSYKDG